MFQPKITGWSLLTLLISSSILTTMAYPNAVNNQIATQQQLRQSQPNYVPLNGQLHEDTRKFAEKPNALKKVELDDIDDDLNTNQIQDSSTGFSWSNVLGGLLTMLFNGGTSPVKSDNLDADGGYQASPWANIISVGLKIVTTLFGGGANSDGIDKVDNGNSPMQFINIVVNLLDALKTSFSHRSLAARSIGKKDSVSDAAVAGISMMKSYVRTYRNADDKCMQKYLCEANSECTKDIGGSSIFCQLGTYATSFVLERSVGGAFENFYEAGRKGRSTGVDCRQIYLECNEV